VPDQDQNVYLTFDDGPTPEITDWVLNILAENSAKATFFCIGKNAVQHPEIIERIKSASHSLGNHTQNHVNGWKTTLEEYLVDVTQCHSALINEGITTNLFRPPYGKLTCKQKKALLKRGYRIVMWDILSGDFDLTITPKKCTNNVLKNITPGSIIIFHDSLKAAENLKQVLPATLAFIKEKGYQTATL
jgi:peptidoglycan/xylan/chitin deacetylase (PgdA/CDA1 family)